LQISGSVEGVLGLAWDALAHQAVPVMARHTSSSDIAASLRLADGKQVFGLKKISAPVKKM
jgi:hypothetical protein